MTNLNSQQSRLRKGDGKNFWFLKKLLHLDTISCIYQGGVYAYRSKGTTKRELRKMIAVIDISCQNVYNNSKVGG